MKDEHDLTKWRHCIFDTSRTISQTETNHARVGCLEEVASKLSVIYSSSPTDDPKSRISLFRSFAEQLSENRARERSSIFISWLVHQAGFEKELIDLGRRVFFGPKRSSKARKDSSR